MDFSGEGRSCPGAHHVVRDVAREGVRDVACEGVAPIDLQGAARAFSTPVDQVVDENDGPGGRDRLGRSYLRGPLIPRGPLSITTQGAMRRS